MVYCGLAHITVTPTIMCMDWLHWYYILWFISFPPIVLPFLIKMGEKLKSTSPNAIPLKNWLETISVKEHLMNCCHISMNDIQKSLGGRGGEGGSDPEFVEFLFFCKKVSDLDLSVSAAGLSHSYWKELYQQLWTMFFHFNCITNKYK